MAFRSRRAVLFAALAGLLAVDSAALAATRTVHVGQGGTHFVDEVSGTSMSTIAVGDGVSWVWSAGFHSTTSGTCGPTTCTGDGMWDSGGHAFPYTYPSSPLVFNTIGTYHYFCSVHGTFMQGDIVVVAAGPAPTVTSIDPTSGPADSGVAVTIGGSDFIAGATVAIGGAPATGVTFQDAATLHATTPVTLSPGTLNDVTVTVSNPNPQSGTLSGGWFADFLDVPQADIFHSYVEKIFRNGVTAGCGGGNYCRDNPVRRDQMAVFLLKAKLGSGYVPPACTGIFPDVLCPSQFADWVEDLFNRSITAGCGGGNYCPASPVSRAQMAPFLLKAHLGSGYTPPNCTGTVFDDVPCTGGLFDPWIEDLANRNITGGCGGGNYCPAAPNTRGQMAVFLVKTFSLP